MDIVTTGWRVGGGGEVGRSDTDDGAVGVGVEVGVEVGEMERRAHRRLKHVAKTKSETLKSSFSSKSKESKFCAKPMCGFLPLNRGIEQLKLTCQQLFNSH